MLPGPSNGGTTAVGAVAPRRPSESERGSSGASGGETGEERGRSTARRGPPLNDAGRGGAGSAEEQGASHGGMVALAPTVATGRRWRICKNPPAPFFFFCLFF